MKEINRIMLFLAEPNEPGYFLEEGSFCIDEVEREKQKSDYLGSFTVQEALCHQCTKLADDPWPEGFVDAIRNPSLHALPNVLYAVCYYTYDGPDLVQRVRFNVTASQFISGIQQQEYREGAMLCPMYAIEWASSENPPHSLIPCSFAALQTLWPYWQQAVVVFDHASFTMPYSLQARSYTVSASDKYWDATKGGNSLYGDCLDGQDRDVRLDQYIHCENGWLPEYCYITQYKEA